MPVQYGYIPAPLSQLLTWADNFSALLVATPAAYMVSAADAASVLSAFDVFKAAYNLSKKTSPTTRTPTTVAATVAAKTTMLFLIRSWASQIRLNPGVSDADKLALGLRLPNNAPSPIPVPVTFPLLTVEGMASLQHFVRFVDSSTPSIKAKPAGVIGMQLYVGVGTAAIPAPSGTSFLAQVTKNPYLAQFDTADAGKLATYFARWITRGAAPGGTSGLVGPFSAALTVGIAA